MVEQDAQVRLQLGKRLEQVLQDKEEALEELEVFKVGGICIYLDIITYMYVVIMRVCL